MILPSKELLSEILRFELVIELNKENNSLLYFYTHSDMYSFNEIQYTHSGHAIYGKMYAINIYELQHKIKEWAFNNDYEVVSRIISSDHQQKGHCYIVKCEDEYEKVVSIFNAPTEFEAVTQACEYILSIKDNK